MKTNKYSVPVCMTLCLAMLCTGADVTYAHSRKEKKAGTLRKEKTDAKDTPPAYAKEDAPAEHTIAEVVVTGQYAPASTDKAVQKIKVIDRKKIDAMAAQNLRDLLSNELNIKLSQDNILGSSMDVQGLSGMGVKIMIDGVPVIGRQAGNIDISQITLQQVERVEIVEGPMSVNYGTDALAGTINLITKKTQDNKWEGGLSTYYETIGNYNLNGRLGFRKGKHTLLVNGGRNFFAGWNPGQKPSLNFSPVTADSSRYMQWKPKTQYTGGLQYIFNTGKTAYNFKSDYFNETIVNRGLPGVYGEHASDDYYHTYRYDNAFFLNSAISDYSRVSFLISYDQYKRIKNTYANDLTEMKETLSTADGMQDTMKYNQLVSRAAFSHGGKNELLSYEAGYDLSVENGTGVRIDGNKKQIGDYAAFASAEFKPVSALTIRPGLRYAYNTAYHAPLTPSLNLAYKLDNGLSLRASYAKGFRSPTIKELYFYFVDINHDIIGNTNLQAENSDNYNVSATYSKRIDRFRYKIDLSAFYNNIHDHIDLAQISGAEYTYINVGKYRTKGAVLNAEISYKQLKVTLGGAYTGRYNVESETSDVSAYSYSPELRANFAYTWMQQGITAAVFCKYTGTQPGYATDESGNVTTTSIGAYSITDISLNKTLFRKWLSLGIGCKNLFDVQNLAVTGNALSAADAAHGTGGAQSLATGRSFFLKADFNFRSSK